MAIFIPRKKKFWQRKPSGSLRGINYNNAVGSEIDIFLPLDGTVEVYGKKSSAKSELLSEIAGQRDYLRWSETGLRNDHYNGDAYTGEALKTDIGSDWSLTDRVIGFQARSLAGNFTKYSFGVFDTMDPVELDCEGYRNGIYVINLDVKVNIGSRGVTFTNAFIRDGEPHTYIAHTELAGGVRTTTLIIDGAIFGSLDHTSGDYLATPIFVVGTGSGYFSRGLNGEFNSVFFINGRVPLDLSVSLSEAPYQILKPKKTYFQLGAVAAPTATLSGSATASITEVDINDGGKQIILDLTNDTWVAAGSAFDAIRQDILDGLVSAQNEQFGWNNIVSPNEPVTSVARDSDTRVIITLEAH